MDGANSNKKNEKNDNLIKIFSDDILTRESTSPENKSRLWCVLLLRFQISLFNPICFTNLIKNLITVVIPVKYILFLD